MSKSFSVPADELMLGGNTFMVNWISSNNYKSIPRGDEPGNIIAPKYVWDGIFKGCSFKKRVENPHQLLVLLSSTSVISTAKKRCYLLSQVTKKCNTKKFKSSYWTYLDWNIIMIFVRSWWGLVYWPYRRRMRYFCYNLESGFVWTRV